MLIKCKNRRFQSLYSTIYGNANVLSLVACGSKQLLVGAFDELDSEAESKVAEESLIASASLSESCSCLPHLAGGSPSLVLSQAVNLSR